MKTKYETFFERFLLAFVGPQWEKELEQAQQEFYGSLGAGGDELSGYEHQADLFFCWFLLNRPLGDQQMTPLESVLKGKVELPREGEEEAYLQGLAKYQQSLYEVLKVKDQQISLKDLVSGEKFKVTSFDSLVGFEKGLILSSWIWPLKDEEFFFVKGLCFHPKESKTFLRKELKKLLKTHGKGKGAEFQDFFLSTLRMKLKIDKYPHVRPQDIYIPVAQARS